MAMWRSPTNKSSMKAGCLPTRYLCKANIEGKHESSNLNLIDPSSLKLANPALSSSIASIRYFFKFPWSITLYVYMSEHELKSLLLGEDRRKIPVFSFGLRSTVTIALAIEARRTQLIMHSSSPREICSDILTLVLPLHSSSVLFTTS